MKKIEKQIVVRAFTPIAKPTNASIQNKATMLLLGEIPYVNGKKSFNTKLYFIKGIRGMFRHACMRLARDHNIEVCHSSEKAELKDGTKLVPQGFHPLGSCDPPCILRNIFGTFREESHISIWADPITSIKHKQFTTNVSIQNVHIASEYRIVLSFDGTTIQDFIETYFSGYFTFYIDVTKLTDDEIKFLMEALLYVDTLGSGKNAGYGRVKILDFDLQKVTTSRKIVCEDESYKITENVSTTPIVLKQIEDWKKAIPTLTHSS